MWVLKIVPSSLIYIHDKLFYSFNARLKVKDFYLYMSMIQDLEELDSEFPLGFQLQYHNLDCQKESWRTQNRNENQTDDQH